MNVFGDLLCSLLTIVNGPKLVISNLIRKSLCPHNTHAQAYECTLIHPPTSVPMGGDEYTNSFDYGKLHSRDKYQITMLITFLSIIHLHYTMNK